MPPPRSIKSLFLIASCGFAASGCYGLKAGSSYPSYDGDEISKHLLTPENEEDPGISLGRFVIKDELCQGLNTHAERRPLAQSDFGRFLERARQPAVQVKARGNLYWYDFPGADPDEGETVRLRLAVLGSAEEAAAELQASLLEHGPGWWGLRRSNLSVLAPKTGLSNATAFAVRHKLVCWGMMSVTGLDDVYVIPGPYGEL